MSADVYAIPDRIALDARGFGWRVWDNDPEHWSMVPTNPDNSPIPQPVTWFVKPKSTEEAELEAIATALGANGYARLMELVRPQNHREARACILGVVRAVVADPSA